MNDQKIIQLELFQPYDEQYLIKKEFEEVKRSSNATKESSDRVRKKLFAENGALKKKMVELEERLLILEKFICQGGQNG